MLKYISTMYRASFITSIILLMLMLASCGYKLKLSKINFDKDKEFYYYNYKTEDVPLRYDDNKLVLKADIDSFLLCLKQNERKYDINRSIENASVISELDNDLVHVYTAINTSLVQKNADAALFFASELLVKYPESFQYTDVSFLQANAWVLKENIDSARHYYSMFFDFSGTKYSKRFHGYNNHDSTEICFNNERQFAINYIQNIPQNNIQDCYKSLETRYYYESNSQGYVWNKEDIGYKQKFFPWVGINYSNKYSAIISTGLGYVIKNKSALNFRTSVSKYNVDFFISIPFQIYKSQNCRFGLKIMPLFYYDYIYKSIDKDNKTCIFTPGISISAGYHFTQNFYSGISYLRSFYNKNQKNVINISGTNSYISNELDISLYYQLLKGISIKAGLVNGHAIVGLTITGVFMGYNQAIGSFGINSCKY